MPDDIGSFLLKLGFGLRQLIKDIKITDLIIDVRGNAGGSDGLLSAISDFLFGGKEIYFSDQESQMVKNKDIQEFFSLLEEDIEVCSGVYIFLMTFIFLIVCILIILFLLGL
jgi:hypothetical protein